MGRHHDDHDYPDYEDLAVEESESREHPMPGVPFLRSVDENQVSQMTSSIVRTPGRSLFKEASFEKILAGRDEEGKLNVEMSWSNVPGKQIIASAREQRIERDLLTRCTCPVGRYPGICDHQFCLILALWTSAKSERLENVHPHLRNKLEPLARVISQNPHDLSNPWATAAGPGSARLESLSFSLPVHEGRGSPLDFFDPALAQAFSCTLPSSREVSGIFRIPSIGSGRGYPGLFTRHDSFRALPRGYFGPDEEVLEQRIKKGLYYGFSNGQWVSVSDILSHPLGRSVPEELLPWTGTEYFKALSSDLPRWVIQGETFHSPQLVDADRALVRVLLAALNLPESNRPALYWIDPDQLGKPSAKCLRIPLALKGRISDPISGQSPVEKGGVLFQGRLRFPSDGDPEFSLVRSGEQWLATDAFLIGRDGKLFFHDMGPWVSSVSQIAHHPGWSLDPQFSSEVFAQLIEKFENNPFAQLEIDPPVRILSAGQWQPRIDIQSEESGFDVSVVPGVGLPMSVLSPVFRVLQHGIGGISTSENREIATRRSDKRESDLRVLRHTGMGALMVRETLDGLLQGQELDEVIRKLDETLGGAAALSDTKDWRPKSERDRQLSRICSKAVNDLVSGFVRECAEQLARDRVLMVIPRRAPVRIEGWVRKSFELLLAYIDALALETGGDCFKKARLRSPDEWTGRGVRFGEARNADFSRRALMPLLERGFEILSDGMPLEQMSDSDFLPEVGLTVAPDGGSGLDWFELNPKYFFRGQELSDADASQLMRQGWIRHQGKIYLLPARQLPSLRRLEAFWAKIQGNGRDAAGKRGGKVYRLPKSRALELLALRASGVPVHGGPAWEEICRFYDEMGQPSRNREPLRGEVHATLKPYQEIGVHWLLDLYRLGLGGILADDMGLGKTLQALAFFEHLRAQNALGRALVVVPTSLTYNWLSEAARFCPDLPVLLFESRDKELAASFLKEHSHGVLICTYGLLAEHSEFFAAHKWNIQLFDEAQSLKNISAKRTTTSRSIPARFKLCLTGTPLENHLGELYSLMDLVVPGCLGELSEFRKRYVAPEDSGTGVSREDMHFLRMQAKPLVLRRTKSQILSELPEKIETTLPIEFEEKQKKIYRDIALAWNEKVRESVLREGEAKSQLQMLTALLRLRQACSDPGAIPQVKYSEVPPKLSLLRDSLEEIVDAGASALVFTQFLHTLERASTILREAKVPHFVIHGGRSAAERRKILADFQEAPGGAVLLMTLKTGGVGLNLTRASYVFHLEPWWNPAVENQATDRAHRIGQTQSVQVFRYIMHESVEEKINSLKARKAARFSAMFSESESEAAVEAGGSHLTQKDFEYLLGLEKPVRR